jgi:hypothetical protein
MRDRLLKPAIDHRRLGQFLTGDLGQKYSGVDNTLDLKMILVDIKDRIN